MPWLETSPVEQRERFIRDHRLELYTMVELCTRYGISSKTGYKWLARSEDLGERGPRPAPIPPPPPPRGRGGTPRPPPTASELGAGEALGLARAATSGPGP